MNDTAVAVEDARSFKELKRDPLYADRVKVYPKAVSGRFRTIKWAVLTLLLGVYSAGLAVPFVLSALAFARMSVAFFWVKRHYSAIMAGGGAVLVLMGVLIWTGELFRLNIEAQRFLESIGLDFFSEV